MYLRYSYTKIQSINTQVPVADTVLNKIHKMPFTPALPPQRGEVMAAVRGEESSGGRAGPEPSIPSGTSCMVSPIFWLFISPLPSYPSALKVSITTHSIFVYVLHSPGWFVALNCNHPVPISLAQMHRNRTRWLTEMCIRKHGDRA